MALKDTMSDDIQKARAASIAESEKDLAAQEAGFRDANAQKKVQSSKDTFIQKTIPDEEYKKHQEAVRKQNVDTFIFHDLSPVGSYSDVTVLPPTVTDKDFKEAFGTKVIEGGVGVGRIYADRINSVVQQSAAPEQFNVDPGQIGATANDMLSKLAGLRKGADYFTGADTDLRSAVMRANNPAEMRKAVEDRYGPGSYAVDNAGNVLFLNPDTGKLTAVDPDRIEMGDFTTDLKHEVPPVLASFAASMALATTTAGQSLWIQLLADTTSYLGTKEIQNQIRGAKGEVVETPEEAWSRRRGELYESMGGFFVGATIAKSLSGFRSPFAGMLTPENRDVYKSYLDLVAIRGKNIPIPLSTLNASPFLTRGEGILNKVPGSAGLYQAKKEEFYKMVHEHFDELVPGVSSMTPEARIRAEADLINKLEAFNKGRIASASSEWNARFTGKNPYTGGEVFTDGVDRAYATWLEGVKINSADLNSRIGGARVIPTDTYKRMAKKQRDKLLTTIETVWDDNLGKNVRRKVPMKMFKAEWDELTDIMKTRPHLNIEELKELRHKLGRRIKGSDPTGSLEEGRYKKLYGALSSDVENIDNKMLPKGMGPKRTQGWIKDWKEFNADYREKHSIFNDRQSPINRIFRAYTPDKLASHFLARGNASNINLMRRVMSKEDFEAVQKYSMEIMLQDMPTGNSLLKKVTSLGEDTVDAMWGKGTYQPFKDYATYLKNIDDGWLANQIKHQKKSGALLRELIQPNKPMSAIQARDALGANTKEWRMVQEGLAERIILDATDPVTGVIQGQRILSSMKKKYGMGVVHKTFEGTDLKKNLLEWGNLLAAAQKQEGSAAGSLASGMVIVQLLRGKVISTGMFALHAHIMARILNTKGAKTWVTNEFLHKGTKIQIRAMLQSLERIEDNDAKDPEAGARQRLKEGNAALKRLRALQ